MAQCEQKKSYFKVQTEGEALGYIDLAAMTTAMNRKQYHQVANSGNPNCYRIRVTAMKGSTLFQTLQNQFLVCRAVKQVGEGWKAQMRHAGIKLRDLPPYGRRPRFALDTGAFATNTLGIAGETMFENSAIHLNPHMNLAITDTFFSTYTSTDDKSITYRHASGANQICANQITQVTVTDGAGTEVNEPLVMVGSSGVTGQFNVITEYLRARRQTPDVSIDTPGPSQDSAMLNLFSTAEEMSDDIVDAIDDYMDYKPYTPDTFPNKYDELWDACTVDQTTSATAQWPYASEVIDVPLGLLKISSAENNTFSIELLAIYEM